ncbi:hypothetical protein BKA64DRAFT_649766 [Cadophora sp. MPI-SDFR-AT-0126]|nr:hypothetical protein BKA64DRAFT_649766 [Leotiomycetes sp. MPI-SDFR-AT-0126]
MLIDLPGYLLENVTIEVPPGLSPDEADYARNILHQLQGNRASGLKVTGLLSVDESQMASLVKYVDGEHPDLNKQYITLDNVLTFSIALDEVTGAPALWVLSETGHFEIRPHQEYRVVYSNMCKAIGLKYFIEDWYEDSEATQTWNSADDEILEILQEFTAFSIGTTDTQHQWVLRCREYKNFFLSQFDQDKIASVLKSSIYQWFKQGCPDLQPSLAIQPYGPEPDAPHFYPVADNSDDEEDDDDDGFELSESMNELFDQENDAQSEVIGNMTTGFKLDYISSEYPQGAPVGASIPVYLAVFICHMVESGRCPNPDTLTLDKIAYAMERDFSIHRYVTCKKLIRYFGQEIAAELPDEYRGYSFYKAMAAFPKELTVDDDKLKDMAKFDLAIIEFNKIVEGSKPFIRRSKTSIEAKKMKDNAAQNGLPIPPRSERNSRAKALVDFEFSTTFDQQQVPGSFNPDTEMKNGQSSSLAPLKPYHERYSAPKWPPELEHCVSPSMRQRWFDSLTPEQRSKHIQETIMRLYEEKLARDALKTPEQLAQEERTRRIKKARKSYDRRLGMRC